MNQSIQFTEREWWDENLQAVCFCALVDGFQLVCAIKGATLLQCYPEQEHAMSAFHAHRWDLEEDATKLIKMQKEDAQGWVWLDSVR